MAQRRLCIGTAGWSIPATAAAAFAGEGTQLQRYAAQLGGVEINSSFYRPHRPQTYARWAASTPAHFRFAVKCPKQISHIGRLDGSTALLTAFTAQAALLGTKWAVLLVQLPPSLAFDARVAGRFFEQAHRCFGGAIVCEPRHASWFTPQAGQLLLGWQVARAAADPARCDGAGEPGGWTGLRYFRWHGSPQMYRSAYDDSWLQSRAQALPHDGECWCIFDNTAAGAALPDALRFQAMA